MRTGEPWVEPALKCRERIRLGTDTAIVPELFFFEMVAVLCRKLKAPEPVAGALRELDSFVRLRFALDTALGDLAVGLSIAHGLSGYDAAYVALARLTESLWITADRKAHERVAALGLSRLVGPP
ncbi:MAG: type II toxin-antitoxin system VapC family toxin [Nitrospirae bacterium]|nr:type II toxin-antitoxin system VapC family toxin [Nitrospirota bacterium]